MDASTTKRGGTWGGASKLEHPSHPNIGNILGSVLDSMLGSVSDS